MSQAGFGDSSSQESISQESVESQSRHQAAPEITPKLALPNALPNVLPNTGAEPTTLFNALPRQVLEQELQFCNERSQQAQVLLRQAQEQLQLSQLVIQRQETLTQTLQARIDQLERELQDVHNNGDELRDRLKRQQHHTSQLKAALERCLDTSASKEIAPKDLVMSNLESWSISKLADEKITPVEQINSSPHQSVVKITPPLQPIEMPYSLAGDQDSEISNISVDQVRQPEPINAPLSVSPKMQPISPLIVRSHKSASGSPIALSLLNTQSALPVANPNQGNDESSASPQPIPKSSGVREFGLQDLQESQRVDRQEIPTEDDSKTRYPHESPISSTSATNSSRISTVVAPKFIRALYSYGNVETPEPPEELAIATSISPSARQPVKTLAAVQLPQFPPLPRR